MSLGNPRLTLIDSVESADHFQRWLLDKCASSEPMLGCDTETGGLDWWRYELRTVQFGDTKDGFVIPWQEWGGLARWAIETWDRGLVFHNAKFDLHFLEKQGIKVGRHRIHDSMVIAHLTNNERRNGLKSLVATLIDPQAHALENELKEGFRMQGWDWDTVPIDFPPYWQYAALDPIMTMHLWEKHAEELKQFQRLYDIEMTVLQSLTDAERRGARIDIDYCREAQTGMLGEAEDLAEQIRGYGVKTPGSRQQLIQAFGQQGVQFTKFTEKGNIALDDEVLQGLVAQGWPLAKLVQDYTHALKIANTYLGNFIDYADNDGMLHASINQLAARTGRMSVSRPSMQNLERSATVRDAVIPREGNKLVLIDFDQIELRLLASYAGMDHIIEAAKDGEDLHTTNARRIFPGQEITKRMRTLAKNVTFAKLYGAGLEKIASMAGISLSEASAFVEEYDHANPELVNFIRSVEVADAKRNAQEGFPYVTTGYGRRLRRNEYKGAYVLVNYLIQGTAADVLKEKIALLSMKGLDEFLVLPVHDELVSDVPADIAEDYSHEMQTVMEEHNKFAAPLTVGCDIVDRWGDPYRDLEAA